MAQPVMAPTSFSFTFPPTVQLVKLDGTNWQAFNSTLVALMCMNGCHQHLTHADAAHADPANPDANVAALWERQCYVTVGTLS